MSEVPSAPSSTTPASPCDSERPVNIDGLSSVQLRALAALADGQTIRDAAAMAGINRMTLSRWLKEDPGFRAAFNAWREELVNSTRARLLRTAELAAGAVHKAIEKGDGRLALALLNRLGLAGAEAAASGITDPAMARQEIAVERDEQKHSLEGRVRKLGGCRIFSDEQRYLDDLCQEADKRLVRLNASIAPVAQEDAIDTSNLDQR